MNIIKVPVEFYLPSGTIVQDVKFGIIQNGSLNFAKNGFYVIYTRMVIILTIFNDKHRLS